jgi:hypothetical protein
VLKVHKRIYHYSAADVFISNWEAVFCNLVDIEICGVNIRKEQLDYILKMNPEMKVEMELTLLTKCLDFVLQANNQYSSENYFFSIQFAETSFKNILRQLRST